MRIKLVSNYKNLPFVRSKVWNSYSSKNISVIPS